MFKVFKFGGASIKDAQAIRNIAMILRQSSYKRLVIVLSAMGKNTNALEAILHARRTQSNDLPLLLENLKTFHLNICHELFDTCPKDLQLILESYFSKLIDHLDQYADAAYDTHYDQTVVFGELMATSILAYYLKEAGFDLVHADVRELIHTDRSFRAARVDWDKTVDAFHKLVQLETASIILIQGFIGGTSDGFSTTLGREGSDYSAAIAAYCLQATDVTIWKDVPGLLNADPKRFEKTVKLHQLSYQEAIELAYYGASVLHPKTLKPLQNKNIPLYIRSFLNPQNPPTVIDHQSEMDMAVPSFIVKDNQMLVSIHTRDASFMDEQRLHYLFGVLHRIGIHAHLIQISALSLSICSDEVKTKLQALLTELRDDYFVRYNTELQLFTVRHYNGYEQMFDEFVKGKEVLLEQRSRLTLQLVLRN